MPTTVATPRKIAATVTTSATLAKGRHTPVDAGTAALTMTLPTDAAAGVQLSVEKIDGSANAVTISGTLRGVASTIPLTTQFEARTFLSEGAGSWRPTSDHRTSAALAATYAPVDLVGQVARGSQLTVYGHSYTPVPGFYITAGREWSTLLANALGMTRTSYGVSGARMIEAAERAIGSTGAPYPAGQPGIIAIECEMNDALFGPATAAGRLGFGHALRAFLAAVTAGQRIESSAATASGTWSTFTDAARLSGGTTLFSTVDNATLTFAGVSAPGGKVYIGTLANTATLSKTGTIKVSVDGVDQGINYVGEGQTQGFTSQISGGGTHPDYSPAVITVTVPATGTHTIVVTRAVGGAGNPPVYVDALYIPSATPPPVLVCQDPPIGTLATSANQTAWNANYPALHQIITDVSAEFPTATVVDLSPGWDNSMIASADTAHFHPGDTGMQRIADTMRVPLINALVRRLASKVWA